MEKITLQEKLTALRGMSAKQLVEYANEEFKMKLKLENGKTWLLKKVGYAEQERVHGNVGRAAERAKELDKPETIKKLKEEDKVEEKAPKAPKEKKAPKTPKESGMFGFNKGGDREKMFGLLMEGCAEKDLEKVTKGYKAVISMFKKPFGTDKGQNTGGRAIHLKENGTLKIAQWTDTEGNVHHNR